MGTFVTALVSMVVVPRTQQQAAVRLPVTPRPDTVNLIGNAALGRIRLAEAESALVAARWQADSIASATAAMQVSDTAVLFLAERDSLQQRIDRLNELIARAEQAPLPSSYRALAGARELRTDPRVRALLDSLNDIEREREGFGAVGGVDPIFVALTSRLSEIGRAIQNVAVARRTQLAAELGVSPAATQPLVAAAPVIDTLSILATQDSIQRALTQHGQELIRRRDIARTLDLEEERARERANAVAPPHALLGAAFVLSAIIGFAVALAAELRRPRVNNPSELERYLGVRVLSTVETPMPSVDRGRREADRSAPPYFDPGAEGYQLSYLGLATEHPTLLMTTVTGDDPTIAAVVACNLGAVAADEARNTLIVDLEPSCRASAALRARVAPGITDVIRGSASWPDATVAARVGRDKTVDLVPFGIGNAPSAADATELLRRDAMRLARYYDAIFLLATPELLAGGIADPLPSPGVIYCAQPGITPLRQLKAQLEAIRSAGAIIRGIVLWNAERPLLPTPQELSGRRPKRPKAPEPIPVAAS